MSEAIEHLQDTYETKIQSLNLFTTDISSFVWNDDEEKKAFEQFQLKWKNFPLQDLYQWNKESLEELKNVLIQ